MILFYQEVIDRQGKLLILDGIHCIQHDLVHIEKWELTLKWEYKY